MFKETLIKQILHKCRHLKNVFSDALDKFHFPLCKSVREKSVISSIPVFARCFSSRSYKTMFEAVSNAIFREKLLRQGKLLAEIKDRVWWIVKYFLLIEGFFIIVCIFLVGCQSAQRREGSTKENRSLEVLLMNDIQDGTLDMPFEQACLIASGVDSNKKMNAYLAKIDILISRIKQETDVNSISDPLKKADIIFGWLQSNINEGTYNDCYDFRDTLNLKVGNCLSYAIRFTTVCRHFGVDMKSVFIPGHIYNMVVFDGQTRYYEHTHSDGIVKEMDLYNDQKRIMKDEELIAEIFLYKARNANNDMKYEESCKNCQCALMCSPDDNRPVILLIDNYIAQKNYDEAFRCLNNYLSRHPNDKKFFKNTYVLLQRLSKKEDNKIE
ncbi:MAG TPA: transglutaminase-like domain-containing protein [Candidatus Brocadia sapporoensis]|nr:transglutaminase domain-containing protein [Candidatus Brocadia sp.]TVL98503.1 MAG: hypothetical protein CV082_00070 [Candidatus Brocadia sp. BL1]HQU29897.1 transglutaminase-like domain-containing protein [Candidatus Brocadia sapporoensis]